MRGWRTVFVSAVTDDTGRVDAGYLALFWTMVTTVNAIPIVLAIGGAAIFLRNAPAGETIQSMGISIGAICTGAGVVIGAVGAFRVGDKPRKE